MKTLLTLAAALLALCGLASAGVELSEDQKQLMKQLRSACMAETGMDDDGVVDADMLLTMLPEEIQPKAEPVVNACKEMRGADACDNAMMFNKCLYEKAPDYYMVV
ncbi:hypothetical protein FOCC_FOCC002858 [Frankliniella occidentalis]|nr:hypothetical protein FOCC_FOCC002858 [Frankliniella occidentalis]